MFRNETRNRFSHAMRPPRGRERVAAGLDRTVTSVKPLAKTSGAAVRRSMILTRAWAAPRVDHAGRFFQNTAAPKISAMLFSAARRIDPARPRVPRWGKLAGASALGAAASVAAATARSRQKQDSKADGNGLGDS